MLTQAQAAINKGTSQIVWGASVMQTDIPEAASSADVCGARILHDAIASLSGQRGSHHGLSALHSSLTAGLQLQANKLQAQLPHYVLHIISGHQWATLITL